MEPECSICLERIQSKNCCITNCNHVFCLMCILRSTANQSKPNCPYCRTPLLDGNYTPLHFETDDSFASNSGSTSGYSRLDSRPETSFLPANVPLRPQALLAPATVQVGCIIS